MGAGEAPRAWAACGPPCAAAVAAIRRATLAAAPKAVRGAKLLLKRKPKARKWVSGSAKRGHRWAKAVKRLAPSAAAARLMSLPRVVRGCVRGFADYFRPDSGWLRDAVIACLRGMFDILVLRKDPLRPIER